MLIEKNRELRNYSHGYAETIQLFLHKIQNQYNVMLQYHDDAGIFVNDYKLGAILLCYYSHDNEFCKYVKMQNNACSICYALKEKILKSAKKLKAPFYGKCHMGFEEFVFPVIVNDCVIGYFTVGEFYSNKIKAEQLLRQRAEEINADSQVLKDKFFKVARLYDISTTEFVTDMNMITNSIGMYIQNNTLIPNNYHNTEPGKDADSKNYVVDTAKEYIFENYNNDVTLTAIAQACHCNCSYLSYIFKKRTGMNISDYINSFRINRAKYYLHISNYSVTQISEMVGFNDSGYFSKVFKKHTGLSPYMFRKNSKHAEE